MSTWAGVTDTFWGDPPGGTSANWIPGLIPTAADAVVINGFAPSNVDYGNNTAECLSIDCTGFTNSLIGSGGSLAVAGNITLSSGMTAVNLGFSPSAPCNLTSAGKAIRTFYASSDVTLLDDALCIAQFNVAGAMDFGVNTLTYTGTESPAVLELDGTIAFSAGAALVVNIDSGNTWYCVASGASNLPPTTINGPGTTTYLQAPFQSLNMVGAIMDFSVISILTTVGDLSFTSGSIINGGAQSLIVGGNFLTNIDLIMGAGFTASVVGTAVAHNALIKNCDFSGGTALDASDNCTNGGGNINVTGLPPIIATSWIGTTSTAWETSDNWNLGVPTSAINAIFDGSATGACELLNPYACKNIDFTGFIYSFDASSNLTVNGDVTLASTMSFPGNLVLNINNNCTFTSDTQVVNSILFTGANTLTLGDELRVSNLLALYTSGATLAFGANNFIGDGAFNDWEVAAGVLCTFDPGATCVFDSTSAGTQTINSGLSCILPPTTFLGAATTINLTTTYKAQTITLSSGDINISGGVLESVEDCSFSGGGAGDLAGATITVGTNFTASIDLVGTSAWTLDVTGTVAVDAGRTITNCQSVNPFSAVGCFDGGGNSLNIDFGGGGPSPILQASGGAVGSTGFGF